MCWSAHKSALAAHSLRRPLRDVKPLCQLLDPRQAPNQSCQCGGVRACGPEHHPAYRWCSQQMLRSGRTATSGPRIDFALAHVVLSQQQEHPGCADVQDESVLQFLQVTDAGQE